MRTKNIPKLHLVIGREFVTLVCVAEQTLFKYYNDNDSLPEEYDAIIDSSAKCIPEVLPTLMLDVRDSDFDNAEYNSSIFNARFTDSWNCLPRVPSLFISLSLPSLTTLE